LPANNAHSKIHITLEDILFSIELTIKRFEKINSSDDFLANEDGLEKSDGISMIALNLYI